MCRDTLEHGANANDRYYRGSVLQQAYNDGLNVTPEMLLRYGANVNIAGGVSISGTEFASPLHAAAMWADEHVVQTLLERAAEATIHARNKKGKGPLSAAVEMVDLPKILLLLDFGARIDIESLHLAATRRHEGTLRVLLEACARTGTIEMDCDSEQAVGLLSEALRTITPPAVKNNQQGFTVGRVQSVWDDGLTAHKRSGCERNIVNSLKDQSTDYQASWRQRFCQKLYKCVEKNPRDHFEALDKLLSDIPAPRFYRFRYLMVKSKQDDRFIVNVACKLLAQLPPTPQPLSYKRLRGPNSPSGELHKDFLLGEDRRKTASGWDQLKVTGLVSTLAIQTALHIALGHRRPELHFGNLLQFLGDILNTAFEMACPTENRVGADEDTWFVVKSFLWATWQRMWLLLVGQRIQQQVKIGIDNPALYDWGGGRQGWQGFSFSPKVLESISSDHEKTPYMCNWAYRLASTTQSPVATDMRGLISRFAELWGGRPPRCKSSEPCSGASPEDCFRFVGATIVDQSMHDRECGLKEPCYRVRWDSASYIRVGASASVFVGSDVARGQQAVAYCEASERTLAISHVWAHGQGGRPETGMNCCLHRRYCDIAKGLDCDSYWIDTMCIPQDHNLRRQAIMSINTIFQGSRACLVCDRDLMEIDISGLKNGNLSGPAQIHLREMILATVVFCDWNVRAWTFLEAMQGRDKILFLCKHNHTISLLETLELVMSDGSLDIGIPFLSTPHLLPSVVILKDSKAPERDFMDLIDDDDDHKVQENNKKLEEVASCLRYRPASRDGDAFVIWTILADKLTLGSPQDFWKGREGTLLTTGFLMSGASRVQAKGLHWAPSEPVSRRVSNLFSENPKDESYDYPEVDMMITDEGEITADGFSASWDVFHLDMHVDKGQQPSEDTALVRDLSEAVRLHFQPSQTRIALLRPLLQAFQPRVRRDTGTARRSVLPFVAVCEFCPGSGGWKWLGVRRLDSDRYLLEFGLEKILLV